MKTPIFLGPLRAAADPGSAAAHFFGATRHSVPDRRATLLYRAHSGCVIRVASNFVIFREQLYELYVSPRTSYLKLLVTPHMGLLKGLPPFKTCYMKVCFDAIRKSGYIGG